MDGWIRPVFTRRQTPTLHSDPTSLSIDDGYMKEDALVKGRATSRVASRMGFLLGSPSVPSTPKLPTAAPVPIIQTPDTLYHKPSPDQMVETLKVVMMNQSSLDPVPIQYNSCILHALEAYHDLQVQLQRKSAELESLKQTHDRDIDDFDELTKAWSMKENDYQKEVKRLEVLLSRTEGGMEAVTMARSQSLVHGSRRASEQINKSIGTVRARNGHSNQQDNRSAAQRNQRLGTMHRQPTQPTAQTEPIFDLENPTLILDKTSIATSSSSSSSAKTQSREDRPKSQQSDNWSLVPSWARATLGHRNPERKRGKQESYAWPGESTLDLNAVALKRTDLNNPLKDLRRLQNKPLPTIPTRVSDRARQIMPKVSSLSETDVHCHRPLQFHALSEMSFSFRPGDDESILSPRLIEDEFESQSSLKPWRRTRRTDPERSDSSDSDNNSEKGGKKQPEMKPKSSSVRTKSSSHIPREFRETYDALSREDSTSSVVTAVRDTSVRSTHSTTKIPRIRRPRLEREAGTAAGEAMDATAKALAQDGRDLPGEPVPTPAASREACDAEGQVQGRKDMSTSSTSSVGVVQTDHHELIRKGL